jgi:Tfp pilus assembly protein PilV
MKLVKNQSGMAVLEVLLLLVVVGIIGFAGYKVHNTKQAVDNQNSANTTTVSDQKTAGSSLPTISNVKELDTASTDVDQVNLDESSSDLNQLDQQLSAF